MGRSSGMLMLDTCRCAPRRSWHVVKTVHDDLKLYIEHTSSFGINQFNDSIVAYKKLAHIKLCTNSSYKNTCTRFSHKIAKNCSIRCLYFFLQIFNLKLNLKTLNVASVLFIPSIYLYICLY